MQEWLNWPLSKSGKAKAFEGSNPSLSAMINIIKSMQETIFTKIIKGEVPSHKVYEDEATFAFLDIHPAADGHTLVIPKKQVEFVWDLEEPDYQALMATVKKVAQRLKEVTGKKYVGTMVVGTDVPHAHVHVVAFYTTSDIKAVVNNRERDSKEPDHAQLAELAEKIRF
jgi:histidine triad (HIT) family protein